MDLKMISSTERFLPINRKVGTRLWWLMENQEGKSLEEAKINLASIKQKRGYEYRIVRRTTVIEEVAAA
jgi:hypothetical protein